MNHKHRHILHSLFAHPISGNIDPQQAFAVIEALGGEVSRGGHGQVICKLAGHSQGFHEAHHSLTKEDVASLRKFIESAGIDPVRDYPLS